MKTDINNYDYALFVDASGCDGIKFDSGSSLCYAVAGYLVPVSDISSDMDVLRLIRKTISGDSEREVKYSTLRKHRRRSEVFPLLNELRGHIVGRISFKKILVNSSQFDSEGKAFSVLAHAIAISSLEHCSETYGKRVLIVVDRMKKTEEEPVQLLANDSMQKALSKLKSYDLVFRDSKDRDFQLLQIADFVSGILREFFELYEKDPLFSSFWHRCPLCFGVLKKHLCGPKGKANSRLLISNTNMKYIISLFPNERPIDLIHYLTIEPVRQTNSVAFLFCAKK